METITGYLQDRHGILFNEQQRDAMLAPDRHTLLLAVPGSGKTTVLVSRIAHLMKDCGVSAKRILTLTYSRESARDMEERFLFLFGDFIADVPKFSTIHSFCFHVLRCYASRYRRQMPELIGEHSGPLLRAIYQEVNEDFLGDDELESLANDVSLVTNLMLTEEDLREFEVTTENFYEIYSRYQAVKKERDWMDYDDMLTYTLDIIKKVPEIRKNVLGKYDYLNIDEAQDTSRVQYEIVRRLSAAMTLFVVGDEDQSIYAFRGAYPDGLVEFSKTYPDALILKIEQNFRSNSDIVDLANKFIRMNKNRYPKNMRTENKRSGSVQEIKLSDYSGQYGFILSLLKQERGNTAVLYRNNESAVPVIDMLYRNGIPFYVKEHNLRFFNSFIVRDIRAFFRLAEDPADIIAFEQIYYKWMCPKTLFLAVKQKIPLFDSVFDAALSAGELPFYLRRKILQYQGFLKQLAAKRPKRGIDWIMEKLGYGEYLAKRTDRGWALKLNILKTLAAPCKTPGEFLEHMDVLQDRISAGDGISKDASITLSSIHSAKGLEFRHVMLIDAIDGIFPGENALEEAAYDDMTELEGEARLFYVAVTRAKEKLTLFTSSYCNDEYVVKSRFISRFLGQEKPPEEPVKEEELDWLLGKTVRHKFFGAGQVMTVRPGGIIEVQFGAVGNKELSYDACREKGILIVLQDEL